MYGIRDGLLQSPGWSFTRYEKATRLLRSTGWSFTAYEASFTAYENIMKELMFRGMGKDNLSGTGYGIVS